MQSSTDKKLTRKEKIAQGLPKAPKKGIVRKEKRMQSRENVALASLNRYPTSPRKMRLLADLVRGMDVEKALDHLKLSTKQTAPQLRKLIVSAITNWEQKNDARAEASSLYVKEISVDSGRMIKRVLPAPQGRAHRINKRSNHVHVIIDSKN